MVKKWIVILSLMILLGVGCVLEYRFVNNSFETLQDDLVEYKQMIESDKEHIDKEENVLFVQKVHEKWHKKTKILKALIWHTGIKDIEVGLSKIETYSSENDFTEALAELDSLLDYVSHYASDFKLAIENLF